MNSLKLTIQIVGWNSGKDLPEALTALQSFPVDEVVIRYIDNNSKDNSVELVKNMLPSAHIVENMSNRGFSGGHNDGFAMCETPFVMIHNPDLILNWPAVKKLLEVFNDPKVGSVQGKLYRNKEETIIDSAGVDKTIALNGKERGANEVDKGQFDKEAYILAATGACAIYRLKALKEVAYDNNEFFDKSFFAYKEDVDLGWRLNNAGWVTKYIPVTLGIHRREVGARGFMNWGLNPIVIFKRLRSPRTRYSLRNYVWMVTKNASLKELITHSPFIGIRLLVFFILTLVYPPNLIVWIEILRKLPKMLKRRNF